MDKVELKSRTKQFALRAMKVVRKLPSDVAGRAVGGQLVRAAMSAGANYRAACRGRSRAEFTAKLGVVLEECDESAYWLELIAEDGMLAERLVAPLHQEADEICAILYAAITSTRRSPGDNAKC